MLVRPVRSRGVEIRGMNLIVSLGRKLQKKPLKSHTILVSVSTTCVNGGIIAIDLAAEIASKLIKDFDLQKQISVACFNSPDSTTVSGEPAGLDILLADLQDRNVFVRKLKTDNKAYHSTLMEPAGQDLLVPTFLNRQANGHNPRFARFAGSEISMFSSVTSQFATEDVCDAITLLNRNLSDNRNWSTSRFGATCKSYLLDSFRFAAQLRLHIITWYKFRNSYVLNSLTGDLLHESWQACSEFGTFMEIGKRDIFESGKLDMRVFGRGATFTAFDLTDLYWSNYESHHQMWHRLLKRTMELLRCKSIKPITPLKTFPVSEITQAFRYFALSTRIGGVVISFDQQATIPWDAWVASVEVYLDGCCSVVPSNFIFMGRSGTDKPEARNLVDHLQASGANIVVIRGSVTDYDSVKRAVSAINLPIGGVIQVAMWLYLMRWYATPGMKESAKKFKKAITMPQAHSSTRLKLTGISVGLGMISEVGYLHERPEIEAVIIRKGLHSLTEEDFLLILDLSLNPPSADNASVVDAGVGAEHHMESHILIGLELSGFQKMREASFMHRINALEDPFCMFLANALAEATGAGAKGANSADDGSYPPSIATALAANTNKTTPDES
ncbi:hypothetical protein EAF04_006971 [Stromatinia cepivora]|nr:hypothetical protein EAF04_006971 [Stromatinia cepivora]